MNETFYLPFIKILLQKLKLATCLNKYRSSGPEVFCKKDILEVLQNSQENTCARVSFKKDSDTDVFLQIFRNF